jgi:hypothetical protein
VPLRGNQCRLFDRNEQSEREVANEDGDDCGNIAVTLFIPSGLVSQLVATVNFEQLWGGLFSFHNCSEIPVPNFGMVITDVRFISAIRKALVNAARTKTPICCYGNTTLDSPQAEDQAGSKQALSPGVASVQRVNRTCGFQVSAYATSHGLGQPIRLNWCEI